MADGIPVTDQDVKNLYNLALELQKFLRNIPEHRADVLSACAIVIGVEMGSEGAELAKIKKNFLIMVEMGYDLGVKMRTGT